jgi:hypothetical protein
LPHPQSIFNIRHARHRLSEVFRATFVVATVDGSRKRHFGAVYGYLDFGSVESVIVGQPFADVFPDAIVGTPVALWTTSPMFAARILAASAFGVFVAKPRRDCISGFIKPATFFAFAVALVPLALVAAIPAAPSLSFALAVATAIVVVAAACASFVRTLARAEAGWVIVALRRFIAPTVAARPVASVVA